MSFQWDIPPDEAFEELALAYADTIYRTIYWFIRDYATEIESWMKQNAPWTDRTGNARKELFADVRTLADNTILLLISHGENISYSTFLELANGGQYSIIGPALDFHTPIIFNEIQRILGSSS